MPSRYRHLVVLHAGLTAAFSIALKAIFLLTLVHRDLTSHSLTVTCCSQPITAREPHTIHGVKRFAGDTSGALTLASCPLCSCGSRVAVVRCVMCIAPRQCMCLWC
eukprot:scaffold249910_cov37-Tisochrysis_lutea.AAC.2